MTDFYSKLRKIIIDLKDSLPDASWKILNDTYVEGHSLVLEGVAVAFEIGEARLKEENKKPYHTDVYEYSVIFMASVVIRLFIEHHDEFVTTEDESWVAQLYDTRHIGFAFFKHRNELVDKDKDYWNFLREHISFGLILYKSMLHFFEEFYGDFANNELAIEMICAYFPKVHERTKELSELIVKSIRNHFRNAGTINDNGYAFGGIEKIESYFKHLPITTVIAIIEDCSLYELLNNPIRRHQVLAAIKGSNTSEEEKKVLKFLYIDSLMIANTANSMIVDMFRDESSVKPYFMNTSVKVGIDKLGVLQIDEWPKERNPYGFWSISGEAERSFYLQNEEGRAKEVITIDVDVSNDNIEIYKGFSDQDTIYKAFDYFDYSLFDINSESFVTELEDFILDRDSKTMSTEEDEREEAHSFSFSYVYLNNYRTLSNQDIDFDHRYIFGITENKLTKKTQEVEILDGFYGKNIFSLSCIVGKNGTGKTSAVDFLRKTFFKILKLVNEGIIKTKGGQLEEASFKDTRLIYGEAEFLVVFNLSGVDYYITNMTVDVCDELKSFEKGFYKRDYQLSKVIFFSSAIDISNPKLFWSQSKSPNIEDIDIDYERALVNFRLMDYSEEKSFMVKHRMMDSRDPMKTGVSQEKYVNKELLYQLFYIASVGSDTLASQIGLREAYGLKLINKNSEDLIITDGTIVFDKEALMKMYSKYITQPESYIGYLSAGQYAKLCLLSKLYWLLNGEAYFEENKKYFGSNVFEENAFLSLGDSALIFMDECELYLHPEWQRTLISDWLNLIEGTGYANKIQFVMTTNSPFIISDVLSEDVHYLPKELSKRVGTFAQNIHMLLMRNFFMENTIGEYSKKMISNIIDALSSEKEGQYLIDYSYLPFHDSQREKQDNLNKLHRLIEVIAEPIYKERLLDMLYNTEDWKHIDQHNAERNREERIKELRRELKRLEGESYDKT